MPSKSTLLDPYVAQLSLEIIVPFYSTIVK